MFNIVCRSCGKGKDPKYFSESLNGSFSNCRHCRKKAINAKSIKGKYLKRMHRKIHHIYTRYKLSAKYRNFEFDLTPDDFRKFRQSDCYFCGDKLRRIGVDRLDNEKGYTKNNCVPCCTICNRMKTNHTEIFFLNHLEKIQVHMRGRTFALRVA